MIIDDTQPCSLGARWIHTMLGVTAENHWVNISEGKVDSLSSKPAHPVFRHFGEHSVIMPAGVNAHAHLELSQLDAPFDVPTRSMTDWVGALMSFRQSTRYDAKYAILSALQRKDLAESTAAVADIVPMKLEGLTPTRSQCTKHIPFVELIAWRKETAEKLNYAPGAFGLSPHAPHTVCPELLERAVAQHVPIAMHLAETKEELQLLKHHKGPLLEMMRRAAPDYDPKNVLLGKRPMDYLKRLADAPKAFIIHGNYLDDEELRFIASRRETMSVVYCPRSHDYFRHPSYPLKKMLDLGVRVLLGTDSLASVPNLSFMDEIRCAVERHRSVSPEIIYRLGTFEGASALDLLYEGLGVIKPGGAARLCCMTFTAP